MNLCAYEDPNMLKEPKKHHFVSAFFIQGFSENGNDGECVWIHDFKRMKAWYARPQGVLFEKYLYSFDNVPDQNTNDLERAFAGFEGESKGLIAEIIGSHCLPPNDKLVDLFRFVAFMSLRNPSSRAQYFNFRNGINNTNFSQKESEKNFQNAWLLKMVEGVEKMTDILKYAEWDVVYVPSQLGTIICPDNPVVFNDSSCEMNIFFPLNRNHLLYAAFNGIGAPDIQTRESLASLNSKLIEFASNAVLSTNEEVLFMLGDEVILSKSLAEIRGRMRSVG